ncbi:MAG: hypothetical protein AAGC60_00150 [Acidobacteriota bacterium]
MLEETTTLASSTGGLAEVTAQIERLTRDGMRTEAEHLRRVTVDGVEFMVDTCGRPFNAAHAAAKESRVRASTVHLSTLEGLVELIADEIGAQDLLVRIAPDRVEVQSKTHPEWLDRDTVASAKLPYAPLEFGAWIGLEAFRIAVLGLVEDSTDRAALLAALKTVSHKEVTTIRDDGTGQSVAVSAGKESSDAWMALPSELTLTARRTFPEVEQPTSAFILRVRTSSDTEPGARLIETDGGLWRIAAVNAVKAYLVAALEEREIELPTFVA